MTVGFTLAATDGMARAGTLHTAHGDVPTPVFMPVGTAGTVKAMTAEAVRSTGARMVLGNTYHLMLRPGAERIAALGGLHRFMDWQGPILTDSGGFQVMSLSQLRRLDEDGVTFRSHLDGSEQRLTPERAVAIQHALGADVTMVLDECTPSPPPRPRPPPRCACPCAGRRGRATPSCRARGMDCSASCRAASIPRCAPSVAALAAIGFDGYAVGGLAVGEGQETMFAMLDVTVPLLPTDRPRYLMGSARLPTSSARSRAASTCSTA